MHLLLTVLDVWPFFAQMTEVNFVVGCVKLRRQV